MTAGLPPRVTQLIDIALDEDLGNGDVTARLTVPPSHQSRGRAVAKQPLVVSGEDVFELVMNRVDPSISISLKMQASQFVKPGEVIMEVVGPTRSLLAAERVALNFLQRLSGVATLTRAYADRIPKGLSTVVTDTRKTSPGMRFLERRAVVHGGGRNHRSDLGGGILIKENHIAASGSITAAVTACIKGAPHPLRAEVEVRNLKELDEALAAGATAVLLDNMSMADLKAAVKRTEGTGVILEASGGVTLDTAAEIAASGVHIISVGALTHSYPAADISFLIEGT
jgi:nicotinate-nucleotide pyrophosphorylase (carboxylating)